MESFNYELAISLGALLVSVITILYTRKNIKLSKYMELITSQRIKWIGELREDLSHVITILVILKNINNTIESGKNVLANDVAYDIGLTDEIVENQIKEYQNKYDQKLKEIGETDFRQKIELTILKLNKIDDEELIELLKEISISIDNNHKIGSDDVEQISTLIKDLLKTEWDKVKSEVIHGGHTVEGFWN